MGNLNIQNCPETGICSIVRADGQKVDLMPDEAADLKAANSPEQIKQVLSSVDSAFAENLAPDELEQLSSELS